jgi:hypothetical protein
LDRNRLPGFGGAVIIVIQSYFRFAFSYIAYLVLLSSFALIYRVHT